MESKVKFRKSIKSSQVVFSETPNPSNNIIFSFGKYLTKEKGYDLSDNVRDLFSAV